MHLTLHLTRSCNLRCDYCYAPPQACEPMSVEVGRKAMDVGLERGMGSCGVVFFGGEPLLQKERIYELIEYGRQVRKDRKGMFHFKITTNGMLLDDAFIEYACREDLIVAMSMDGIRPAHDAHRKTADGRPTFEILYPRLKALLKAKPYSSVIMIVNPDTVRFMAESVSFLFDEGVRYLILSPNYAAGWGTEDLEALQKQYQRLARQYIQWTRRGRKFYFSPFEVKIASRIHADRTGQLRCDLGMRQISVDPEGYLFPCVQFPRAGKESDWCIGHVDRGIDGDAWTRIRTLACQPKQPCRDCAVESRCFHTCACLNWQTGGSITEASPILCKHEQMVIPIADRIAEKLYAQRDRMFIQKHYNDLYPYLSLVEDQLSGA
ncbi:MAG: radical SAM protein [Phycisphaerae bacterium]|nr:radical SAM protein [Phycisphaerae bacterium]